MPFNPAGAISGYRLAWASAGRAGQRVLIGGFVYAVRILTFSVAFPLFAKSRGFSSGETGLLVAAVAFSLFLFGIPIIWGGSRGHARALLIAGPLVAASGQFIILGSPNTPLAIALAGCLLSGMASNVFWVLGDPILAAGVPAHQRSHVFALKFTLFTLGLGVGGLLGGLIPASLEALGATEQRALAGAMIAIAMLDVTQSVIYRSMGNAASAAAGAVRDDAASPRELRAGRHFWIIVAALLVPEIGMAFGLNAMRPFLSLFFKDRFGLSTGSTGTVIGVMQVVGGFAALLIPAMTLRLGNPRTIALMRMVGAIAIVAMLGATALPVVIALLFVQYATLDGTEAAYISEVMTRLPSPRRTAFAGIAAMSWSAAAAIAASASGFLQQRTGDFNAAFSISVVGLLCSSLWCILVFPRIPPLFESPAKTIEQPDRIVIGEPVNPLE